MGAADAGRYALRVGKEIYLMSANLDDIHAVLVEILETLRETRSIEISANQTSDRFYHLLSNTHSDTSEQFEKLSSELQELKETIRGLTSVVSNLNEQVRENQKKQENVKRVRRFQTAGFLRLLKYLEVNQGEEVDISTIILLLLLMRQLPENYPTDLYIEHIRRIFREG